jgi:hypothetical protein
MSTIHTEMKFNLIENTGMTWRNVVNKSETRVEDTFDFNIDFEKFLMEAERAKYEFDTLGPHHFRTPGKYNPPIGYYTQISCASVAKRDYKHLVGGDGYFIDVMTYRSAVDYIWLNKEKKIFEIFSEVEGSLENAKERLLEKIAFVNGISAEFEELNSFEY